MLADRAERKWKRRGGDLPLNLSPIVSLFGLCSAQKVALLGKLTDQLQPPFLLICDPLSRKGLSLPAT